ncbi:DNA sulfur modification protein DndB [Kitasatospora sp. NPDC036755]|uniref:DNA sulfur modification protein DndB n=1 Tax=Kitasatospora sp. NPDC036755 TaxID=3154600 RepID=UPI0033EDE337
MTDPREPEYVDQVDLTRGRPFRLQQVSDQRYLAIMPWGQLHSIVPDPRPAEMPRMRQYLSPAQREQAELRNEIQRAIQGTKKKANARDYARYIADGLRGIRDERWATPPFALWLPGDMDIVRFRTPFGDDLLAYMPFDATGVLVDAETQHLAHIMLLEEPAAYGLTKGQVSQRLVSVEIYHQISLRGARQIFHDRNLLGVIPNKNVALAADSSNLATDITHSLLENVVLPASAEGQETPLGLVVSARPRQLKATDTEWMTLSSFRAFVVTAIFGRSGFDKTSGPISDLPEGCTPELARQYVGAAAKLILGSFAEHFERRTETVIAAPAMLAALGAVAYRSMPWSPEPRRSPESLLKLLSDVRWARDPRFWDGTVGKATTDARTGMRTLSLAGGVKDSGSKTAAALEDPASPRYQQIRGYTQPAVTDSVAS